MYTTPDPVDAPLYVITPLFNPVRFKSRWKLYQRFAKYVRDSGAILVTVEAAFAERAHSTRHQLDLATDQTLTRAGDHSPHRYLRVRTAHELWIKENLINRAIAQLPADWKYVAWVDADVAFARPNWVGETIHQLQHYAFVQLFSRAVDLGPTFEPVTYHRGFVDCYLNGGTPPIGPTYYQGDSCKTGTALAWHPGFAWAARREAIDAVGGLIDFSILGAGDRHMACGLIGHVEDSMHPGVHPEYRARLEHWQGCAERAIRHNVGCLSGLLLHYWHGKKRDRRYMDRWEILVRHQFDPSIDLRPDWQGVYQLCDHGTPRTIALRDEIRAYFRQRNEDSIDA